MRPTLDETKRPVGPCHLVGKRVVAVVYSSFPADPRPRRAAEILVKEGASVEVICLRETDDEPQHETFNGVDITRVPLKRRRGGKLSYLIQYGSFILIAGAILAGRALKNGITLCIFTTCRTSLSLAPWCRSC